MQDHVSLSMLHALQNVLSNLISLRLGAGMYREAYQIAREASRFMLSVPWLQALDHIYLLTQLTSLAQGPQAAQAVLDDLRRGEQAFGEAGSSMPDFRSRIARAAFLPARPAPQELIKISNSLKRRSRERWAETARTLAENIERGETFVGKPPFARFARQPHQTIADTDETLAQARFLFDSLGLPGFASGDAPLPERLPWMTGGDGRNAN